jgi:heterodisulfide reductase subunit A
MTLPEHGGNGHEQPKIGVYVCHCGINIASKVNVAEVIALAQKLPHVTVAREYRFMCSDLGQELIQKDIEDGLVNRIIVASCSPLMHEMTFRNAVKATEHNPFFFQMANIREHVSWVTADKDDATIKAKALIAGAVHRVAKHFPLETTRFPVHPEVAVVGGGIAGIHAALVMAESGKKTYLVEREPAIGGHMAKFDKTFPTLDCAACILTPKMSQVRTHPNLELLAYSEVVGIDGYVGNFTLKVRRKARFVKEDLCNGCGECVNICPVRVPSEFDAGLGTRTAIFRPFPQAVPNVFTISRPGTPPCQAGCPIHQNAQGYVTLIAQGKFTEALDVVLRDNPLPSVCGRICTHPCMSGCTRRQVDESVNVPALKRFVADYVFENQGDYSLPRPEKERSESVAIVGSGPAGLLCAYELRKLGYQTTIYEALPVAGGMLAAGIPAFRLPREVLLRDIRRLEATGIRIQLNAPIGPRGVSLEQLRKNHQAVFLAVGAHVERKLNVPGEDLAGVWGGIEFLRKVNLGEEVPLGKEVVVVVGGNSAIDAARTALRKGARKVRIVYRRTRAEMPAESHEIDEALREGVEIDFLAAPKSIRGHGRVQEMECLRMALGEPDASGRPQPVPISGSEFVIPCDMIIATIGQVPDVRLLAGNSGFKLTRWRTLEADPLTLETGIEGVFAGGDCVTDPDVVVTAMAAGKKAAISIHRYLNHLELRAGRELECPYESTISVDTAGYAQKAQVSLPAIEPAHRHGFDEVYTGYTREQAVQEAARCMNCAVCCDCRLCATVCEPKAIDYTMRDEIREIKAGAVILATGFKPFDAKRMPQYGYGRFPNVFTSVEVERLVNAAGPTSGEIVLRGSTDKPQRVGIIHCVGSRDKHTNNYCSRVCCMYSLKLAHLIRERTGAEVYNFYIDMRTPGKGYEEFYDKLLHENVHFIRGRVAEVTDWALSVEEVGKLVIRAEDTLLGFVRRIPVDMVVLSVGLEPQTDAEEVRRMFNISCSSDGWFLERHPKLAPVSTFTDGIFLAGACQGPKDIPDTVAQAGAAAAEVMALVDRGYVEIEPNVAVITEDACSGCRLCTVLCPYSAISYDAVKTVSAVNAALCKGCGTCVASCPSGAAQQNLFTDEQIFEEIEGLLSYV